MKHVYLLVLCLLFLYLPLKVGAIPAYPFPVEYKQPNGETITIRIWGDEYFHYTTTLEGFLVTKDKNGFISYAVVNSQGQLVPGTVRVSNNVLKSAQSGFLKADSKEFIEKVKQPALVRVIEEKLKNKKDNPQLRSSAAVSGSRRGLVILVNFKDVKYTVTDPKNSFSQMLNQVGYSENGATGSARDFYISNSNGRFTPDFDVYGPVDLPQDMVYYGGNDASGQDKDPGQMIVDACKAANTMYPNLNFADYDYDKDKVLDNVFVFYAGYNEAENSVTMPNTVWPHKYNVDAKNVTIDGVKLSDYACTSELRGGSGTNMAGIGTFTHEFGHVLGLPDLYDADGDVNTEGAGVGAWCTMGSGSYLNSGRTPPNFGAMERYLLGWITPTFITVPTDKETKTLMPIVESADNQAFRLETSTPGEYYIFEARKKQGWDTYMLGEGMLVYHIDQTTTRNKTVASGTKDYLVSASDLWELGIPNIMGNHQCMDLLRANNIVASRLSDPAYAGNPYPGTNLVTTISDYTTPGFLSWNQSRTYAQISNISRNASDGSVSFDFVKSTVSPYPYIKTDEVTNIFQMAATLNASLLENGTSPVTEKGFCWNTAPNPTKENSTAQVFGVALGPYSTPLSNLSAGTLYYVRAYVKTQDGSTYYGNEVSFRTLSAKQKLPFTENFTNGIPDFWTIKDNNHDGVSWVPRTLTSQNGEVGTAAIVGNNNVANDWLITPQLAIPSGLGDINLNFYVAINSAQRLNLMVSEISMDAASFSDLGAINYEYEGTGDIQGWYSFSNPIKLNEYVGKSIFLAFVGTTENATSKQALYLTNITLTTQYNTGTEKIETNVPLVYVQGKSIYFGNVYEKYGAEIYDTSGRLHYRMTVASETSQSMSEPGIYIIKLKNDKQTYTYKLIVR